MPQLVYMLQRLISFYELLICLWALMSFIPTGTTGAVYDFRVVLARACEPYINLFRRFIPPVGGLDFSPVIAIAVLSLVSRSLSYILL